MKTIIVVGASNGIGKASAEHFLGMGYKVLGVDKESSKIEHQCYQHFSCDLYDSESVHRLGEQVIMYNPTDLVYCAAEQHIFPSINPKLDLLHRMFTVNVASAWQLTSYIQQRKMEDESALSSVVFISSVHAIATSGSIAGYAMSKAALSSLVRSLAIDFSKHRTRVNGIIPGAVKTRMLTDHLSDDDLAKLAKRQLVDHIAEPKEIAGAVAFLTSHEASYITGQNFIVDGGVLALLATEAV